MKKTQGLGKGTKMGRNGEIKVEEVGNKLHVDDPAPKEIIINNMHVQIGQHFGFSVFFWN